MCRERAGGRSAAALLRPRRVQCRDPANPAAEPLRSFGRGLRAADIPLSEKVFPFVDP